MGPGEGCQKVRQHRGRDGPTDSGGWGTAGPLDASLGKLQCGVPVGGIRKAGPAVQGGDCCQVYGNGGWGQGTAELRREECHSPLAGREGRDAMIPTEARETSGAGSVRGGGGCSQCIPQQKSEMGS